MNGRYLLDTNAVIALLNGHTGLTQLLASAAWVGISVITELEFLSFSNLPASDEALFAQFKSRVAVVGLDTLDTGLMEGIIGIRRGANLKLPDAIIAATSISQQATLLSNDAVFFRISVLSVEVF